MTHDVGYAFESAASARRSGEIMGIPDPAHCSGSLDEWCFLRGRVVDVGAHSSAKQFHSEKSIPKWDSACALDISMAIRHRSTCA